MNQVRTYNKLMLSYRANTFLSALRRFPFIGQLVPQNMYRYYKSKVFFWAALFNHTNLKKSTRRWRSHLYPLCGHARGSLRIYEPW